MLRICGIDPSISSTGISILDWDTNSNVITLHEKTSLVNKAKFDDRWKKKMALIELFEYYMDDVVSDIDFFIIENYSYGSVGYLADAGELVGMMKAYMWAHKKPFDMIAPMTVKKLVGGSGLSSKEQVAESLKDHLSNYKDVKFNNLDESDATAIAVAYIKTLQNESRKSNEVPDRNPKETGKRRTRRQRVSGNDQQPAVLVREKGPRKLQ